MLEYKYPVSDTSCLDIKCKNAAAKSMVYTIQAGKLKKRAYCDMETDNGGWTVGVFSILYI